MSNVMVGSSRLGEIFSVALEELYFVLDPLETPVVTLTLSTLSISSFSSFDELSRITQDWNTCQVETSLLLFGAKMNTRELIYKKLRSWENWFIH